MFFPGSPYTYQFRTHAVGCIADAHLFYTKRFRPAAIDVKISNWLVTPRRHNNAILISVQSYYVVISLLY